MEPAHANKYLILTEGIADLVFIKTIIQRLEPSLTEEESPKNSPDSETKTVLFNHTHKIVIFATGGYAKIKTLRGRIEFWLENNFDLRIIFDADYPRDCRKGRICGGFANRLEEIRKDLTSILGQNPELIQQVPIFLFPDNKSDGDLETLLLRIVDPELFGAFIPHLLDYAEKIRILPDQVKRITRTYHEEISSPKSQIFNYLQVYVGQRNAKESQRDYTLEDYWKLEHEALEPLKQFLRKHLKLNK